jgi:HSF-type DNA-binding
MMQNRSPLHVPSPGSHGTLLRHALGIGMDHQETPPTMATAPPPTLHPASMLVGGVPSSLLSQGRGGGGGDPLLGQWQRDAVIMSEIRRLQLETAGRNALMAAQESAMMRDVALAQGAWGYGCGLSPAVASSSPYGHPFLLRATHQGQIPNLLSIQDLQVQASKSLAARVLLQRSREMLDSEEHRARMAAAAESEASESKVEDLQDESVDLDKSRGGTVPSERLNLSLPEKCESPADALKVLTALGTTLRSKSDPFIDASAIEVDPKYTPTLPRRGANEIFPEKLYKMLREVEDRGLTDVVSFMGHGRAFRVHKVDRFVQELMPEYFPSLGKWSSFSRQCNLWGFLRCTEGENPDCNAYYHELFLRGHSGILRFMRRVGVPHGKDRRKYRLPEGNDPNFYSMKPMPDFEDRQGKEEEEMEEEETSAAK